jgi:hypothetical protein
MRLTIILGTGRCGSTMVSDLVNEHPDVLSLSELFAALDPLGFTGGEPTGAEFWSLLSDPRPKPNTLLRKGIPIPEYRYPVGSGRFRAGEVPAISLMTLPPLTDAPDALYDRLHDEVTGWPAARQADQYRRLFGWLAERFGRQVVIERSGASLRYVPQVLEYFPEARFVFMFRHGPDTALSMSRYPLTRLALLCMDARAELGVDPFEQPDPSHADRLPERLRLATPETLTASALAEADIPLERFGWLWSYANVHAIEYLADLPADQLLTLCYDRLVADPVPELARLGRFAGIPDAAGWACRVAGNVDRRRGGAAAVLDAERAERLDRACAAGREGLAAFVG